MLSLLKTNCKTQNPKLKIENTQPRLLFITFKFVY